MNDKPIQWTDDLRTGDAAIDGQHKAFFIKALRLHAACQRGCGETEIADTLKFMREYAASHFADEEARMLQVRYPYLESHRETHRAFLVRLDALEEDFFQSENKRAVARLAAEITTAWFVQHISMADRPLIEFMQGARTSAPK